MISLPPSDASMLATRMKRGASAAGSALPSPLWGGSAPTDRREAPSDDRLRAGGGGGGGGGGRAEILRWTPTPNPSPQGGGERTCALGNHKALLIIPDRCA